MRTMWSQTPFPLDFRIYLFNITNADEIKTGAKPIVEEVGPFFYELVIKIPEKLENIFYSYCIWIILKTKYVKYLLTEFFISEWKEKVDLVDREEDDTVEYNNKATWIFNKKKSGRGLHEDMELVFPHIMILSMVYATVRERPGMVGLAGIPYQSIFSMSNYYQKKIYYYLLKIQFFSLRFSAKAVDSIFHKPDSVFVKATVREILWTGLPVDCSVQDFAGKAVCGILREDDSALLKDGPDNYKFALFGPVSFFHFSYFFLRNLFFPTPRINLK